MSSDHMDFLLELFNGSFPFDPDAECTEIHEINASLQCVFAMTIEDCVEIIEYLDYNYFTFCHFGMDNIVSPVIICFLWLFLLFIALGVTSNCFLCPALFAISKHLRMSQNVAGVTLLAFGNGSPDIFSSVAGLQKASAEMAIASLVGAGVFVTTVVAGSVFLTQPFSLMIRPFLRDIIFYIISSSWTFGLFFASPSYIYHGIGFVALYFVYIIVVLFSRLIYLNREKHKNDKNEKKDAGTQDNHLKIKGRRYKKGDDPEMSGVVLKAFYFSGVDWFEDSPPAIQNSKVYSVDKDCIDNTINYGSCQSMQSSVNGTKSTEKLNGGLKDNEDRGEFWEFLCKLCPINLKKWHSFKWWGKSMALIKSPSILVMKLTVPVMDNTTEDQNWCRLLSCLQCIMGPVFITLISENSLIMLGGILPLIVIILLVTFGIALLVFCTSKRDHPPPYHWVFAYLGFAVAVTWIYCLANEIVALLQVFGVIFNLSDAVLGLTILAWGNSLSDFLSNLAVARKEFPRMGISACFGGPLLALLLGLGIPCIIEIVKGRAPPKHPLTFSGQFVILFCTLAISLLTTTAVMIALKFETRRSYGVFLLALYAAFVVLAVLEESQVFHWNL